MLLASRRQAKLRPAVWLHAVAVVSQSPLPCSAYATTIGSFDHSSKGTRRRRRRRRNAGGAAAPPARSFLSWMSGSEGTVTAAGAIGAANQGPNPQQQQQQQHREEEEVDNGPALVGPRPEPRPLTTVTHGITRIDPYAWLARKDDADVQAHLREEQKHFKELHRLIYPQHQELYREMSHRVAPASRSPAERYGDWWYFSQEGPGQHFPVLCRRRQVRRQQQETLSPQRQLWLDTWGRGGEWETQVVLDHNELAKHSNFLDVGSIKLSNDHHMVAYTVDTTGGEVYQVRVHNLQTGQILDADSIPEAVSVEWEGGTDETLRSFLYTVPDEYGRPYRVYRHVLGQCVQADELLFEEPDAAFLVDIGLTKDQEYVWMSTSSKVCTDLYVMPVPAVRARCPELAQVTSFQLVQPRRPNVEYFVEHLRGELFVATNENAPNYHVVALDALAVLRGEPQPGPARVVVPAKADTVIEDTDMLEHFMVTYERKDGSPQIRVTPHAANGDGDDRSFMVPLPGHIGVVTPGSNQEFRTNHLRFSFESPLQPVAQYDFDLSTRELTLLHQDEIPDDYVNAFDEDGADVTSHHHAVTPLVGGASALARDYECYRSHTPCGVPLTMVHRKGLVRDGNNPALLSVYGAYGMSLEARFSVPHLSLLQRGWVLAMAHVRGGGELGREWYDGGRLDRKENSVSDLLACATTIQAEGYTSPERCAVTGTSAGGLTAAAAVVKSPSLFRAALLRVPFVDCLTTMTQEGEALVAHEYDEWGDLRTPEAFRAMLRYSPYDNVQADAYPHLLLTGGVNDTRVGFHEPLKFAAKVRAMQTNAGRAEVVCKVDVGAGHFGDGGKYNSLYTSSLYYAFLMRCLDRPSV